MDETTRATPPPDPARSPWGRMRDDLLPWARLSDGQWVQWVSIFRLRRAEAREELFAPGTDRHELIYVSNGLLRFYYLTADGSESTKAFVAERSFAGALAAAALGLPVVYGVEALEPSTLLVADLADVRALYDRDPVFDRIGRRFAELLLARKELRARSLLQQSATERWLELVERHPELVRRVPQVHLASYLGVTESSLSRLKRELREAAS